MIPVVSPRFLALSEKLGGFDPQALRRLLVFNNPFHLKHWTMNVIELLLIAGASWGFLHALARWRRARDPTYLAVWWASVVFMLVIEIPVYFPQAIGGDPDGLLFLHNEFTVELLYDRAPLYIMALYPALMYSAYALVEQTGVFLHPWGNLTGATAVGFVHHCFYEIFDHFGPQYGWWVWNYPKFVSTFKSVPTTSMFVFAFLGPCALALLCRLLVARYVSQLKAHRASPKLWRVAVGTTLAGVLTPFALIVLSPATYYQLIFGALTPIAERLLSFPVIAAGGVVTLKLFFGMQPQKRAEDLYPVLYLAMYLATFAILWAYGLPAYVAAINGVTRFGTLTGSLPYVAGCYLFCLLFIMRVPFGLRGRARGARGPRAEHLRS